MSDGKYYTLLEIEVLRRVTDTAFLIMRVQVHSTMKGKSNMEENNTGNVTLRRACLTIVEVEKQ